MVTECSKLSIGIDASNIGVAGGATHLVEILRHLDPSNHNIGRVLVWGGQGLLDRIESREWLELLNPSQLERSLLHRLYWQQFRLAKEAADCDVLFVPGGLYLGRFRPFVTMMRNMLPFDLEERARYGISVDRLRLHLLEWGQRKTFQRAAGTIFLTRTSQNTFVEQHGKLPGHIAIIPHGVNKKFAHDPETRDFHHPVSKNGKPFRWLYVSPVRLYKHQWNVVRAVEMLEKMGYSIELDLVGHANSSALTKLRSVRQQVDPGGEYIRYHGRVPHRRVDNFYRRADGFVFASTCETFGQVLTEAMQTGLPIACSNRSTAPEVVQDAGEYFDPERPDQIAAAMQKIMEKEDLRKERAQLARERADEYSWSRCARETFSFILDVCKS